MILAWQPVADPDFDAYEVRRGSFWAANRTAYVGRAPQAEIDEAIGTETFIIRARNLAGRLSERPITISVTTAVPAGWHNRATSDEHGASWPGTLTDLSVNADGFLEIDAGAWAGTYVSSVIDARAIASHYWSALANAEAKDLATTGLVATWSADDARSREWTSEGREPTYGRPGYDLDTTAADLTGTALDYGDRLIGTGWRGSVGRFAELALEIRYSDDATAWGAWERFRNRIREARYAQWRATLKRGVITDYQVVLRSMSVRADMVDSQRTRLMASGKEQVVASANGQDIVVATEM